MLQMTVKTIVAMNRLIPPVVVLPAMAKFFAKPRNTRVASIEQKSNLVQIDSFTTVRTICPNCQRSPVMQSIGILMSDNAECWEAQQSGLDDLQQHSKSTPTNEALPKASKDR